MMTNFGRLSLATALGAALLGLALASAPAFANNKDKNWNRGCEDAKAGSYNRNNPSDAYERGWQSCKGDGNANAEAQAGKDRQAQWDRGCADSKAKTYDRAHHNADYEAGWQACKSD